MAKFRLARRKHRRGAEPRDKARARVLSRWDWLEMVVVVAILSLIVASVYKLRQPGTVPIQRVHFEGVMTKPVRAELIRAVAPRLAGNFFTVDLQAIEAALTRFGWVKIAAVRRQWPDALVIRVREQIPVAQWGRTALLNRTGQIFRPQGGRLPADLPILQGPSGRSQNVLVRYRQLTQLLKPANLSARALVEDERRAWHLLLDNGVPIDIGRGNPDARVARFARVYPDVLAPRAAYIRSIDLRYTNGLAVAWKQLADNDGRAIRSTTNN